MWSPQTHAEREPIFEAHLVNKGSIEIPSKWIEYETDTNYSHKTSTVFLPFSISMDVEKHLLQEMIMFESVDLLRENRGILCIIYIIR
jgi:hypothetical protein